MENNNDDKNIDEILSLFESEMDESFQKQLFEKFGFDIKELEEKMVGYIPVTKLIFEKLDPSAITPKYNYQEDSGFDLHSIVSVEVEPLSRALVPTGLSFNIPEGYEIQVRSKSGLAINQGIFVLNSPGTVDRSYKGEIKVIIFNTNNKKFKVEKGMKIAQAVLCPVACGKMIQLTESKVDINSSERKDGGFGSTGLW